MGTITSSIPRGLPNVSSLATSVSAKRLNWTSLSGLIAGIMGPARPVWLGGDGKNINWRLEPFTSAPAHRSSTADALALIAFAYIGGQSAAYLWSSHSDQG